MSLACLILAAGQGTRMRSSLPKVLHPIAGLPMIQHVIRACEALGPEQIWVVVAPDMEEVKKAALPHSCVVQASPLGTGDAVLAAREALKDFDGDVIVLFGDTPMITPDTLDRMRKKKAETGAAIVVGGFTPYDPLSYGRLVVGDDGQLLSIVEAADATVDQILNIRLCNGGIMLFEGKQMWPLLAQLTNNNAKKEYYLTDSVELANRAGLKVTVVELPAEDLAGVNTRSQLADLDLGMQWRLRLGHMMAGVTMLDPSTVYLCADTKLGQDVVLEPHVVFGLGVSVEDNVTIKAFSHLEGVHIESSAVIGPFARLRPGAKIGSGAHIGNFVEIKKSVIGPGAKINHLSYIGDARVGAKTNIGAGTITCNYDGFTKSQTEIGAGAFVGSNSSLVAPVSIGDGAIIAAGSTITQDVPAQALGVARERQTNNDGWAKRFREEQGQTTKVGRA